MKISKLQYISNYQSKISHLEQIKQVVNAGVSWVQYRPKDIPEDKILSEGAAIADFCKNHQVVFIMNDHVEIAKELNADGVHLGKDDMSLSSARKILGEKKIIGGTSNILEDILEAIAQGVNYVGLGPFRFTQTKKNLSPVLGLNAYAEIVSSLKNHGFNIPIVAIGGITTPDIAPLLNTGIHGIALSSYISEAKNITIKTTEILNEF